MRFIAAFRDVFEAGRGASPTCFGCLHFSNDPAAIEAALPGLSSLSSGHASVRADDGICRAHETICNGKRRCGDYRSRWSAAVSDDRSSVA